MSEDTQYTDKTDECSRRGRIKAIWCMSVIFFMFMLSIFAIHTYYHENAHEQISIHHGCLEPEIHYNMWGINGGYFNCNKYYEGYNETIKEKEDYYHLLNEIIGYNIQTGVIAISIAGYLIAYAILIKDDKR